MATPPEPPTDPAPPNPKTSGRIFVLVAFLLAIAAGVALLLFLDRKAKMAPNINQPRPGSFSQPIPAGPSSPTEYC